VNRPRPPAERHPAERIWRSPLRQLLVLAGLAGFAISQPILGLLGDEPTILARHGTTSALVTGAVSGGSDEQRLILAIDGVVAGGSALSTDSDGHGGRFAVLLPQGALEGHNEIRAALLQHDGEVLEVEVRSP
jgi:hypothetical protein